MSFPSHPLTDASTTNDIGSAESLLKSGYAYNGSIDAQKDRVTAMSTAVRENQLLLVDLFLTYGIKPTGWDFIEAVKQCSYAILDCFLESGFDINQVVKEDQPPPLSDALFDLELVQWLLERGANPNTRCKYDCTPLSITARCATREVLELLFKFGASTQYGQPLHHAIRANRENEIVELLMQRGSSPNIIEYEENAPSYNHFGFLTLGTPLHEAVKQDNKRLIRLLLSLGADPHIKDTAGNLPQITRARFETAL